jgi:3-oxoadipate enol-lactonase
VRERGLEAIADSVVERWFTAGFRSDHPESADRFRRMLVATPPEGYAACCDAIARWDARGRIHAIATPTLVVAGQEDPATTTEHTLLITREIRGSPTTTLAGAAHLANVEQPVLFSRALLGHLGVSSRSHEAA